MANEERKDTNNNKASSFKGTAMFVASGVTHQQHAGTTMILEFKTGMFSSHINKLEQHQDLQLLDILKSSACQHQTTNL
eukprot:1550032-Amphidinium_carterae.1